MADIIEFETGPRKLMHKYKVTNNAIQFRVKALGDVILYLSETPTEEFKNEIILQSQKCIFNLKAYERIERRIRDLISLDRFSEFWLTWRNKTLILGQGTKLLFVMDLSKYNELLFKYVSFTVDENGPSATWQIVLPPKIEKSSLKPLEGGEPRWIKMDSLDVLPADAILGGFETEFLYIIRAKHYGSLIPGKFVPSLKTGIISCNRRTYNYEKIEILCGYNCWWEPCTGSMIPAGAVFAGKSGYRCEHLYVGRVRHKSFLIVGKVMPSRSACYFEFEEQELNDSTYEVLVAPSDDRQICIHW